MENSKAYLAELAGTFTLVFFIVMSISTFGGLFGSLSSAGLVGIATAHGLVLMVLVYSLGKISGAYFNPAIVIAHIAAKKLEARKGAVFIVLQLVGATLAGIVQWLFVPASAKATSYGLAMLSDAVGKSMLRGFGVELILTAFLAAAVYGVVSGKVPVDASGWAVGGTLFMIILIGAPLTGASVNPAREFGPALVNLLQGTNVLVQVEHWLVYWLGPIIGALLGTFVFKWLAD